MQRSLVCLIEVESKLCSLVASYTNYRKQLYITSNSLPEFITDDFPELKILLVRKLTTDIGKIHEEIDENLHLWTASGENVLIQTKDLKILMNKLLKASEVITKSDRKLPDKNEIFCDESVVQFLEESTPSSFSPIRWFEIGTQLSTEILHESKFWHAILLNALLNEPAEVDLKTSVPKRLECVKLLQSYSPYFSVYLEFNSAN